MKYKEQLSRKGINCILLLLISGSLFAFSPKEHKTVPLRVVVDLNVGEVQEVTLSNSDKVVLELISIKDSIDLLNSAVRAAWVVVVIDGQTVQLTVANYNLPVTVGKVQIDCPVTKAYKRNSLKSWWGLEKDARLRLWHKSSSYLKPGTFVYPIKQKILAGDTQMGNEPVFVNGGEKPGEESIYYHSGLDLGGSEGRDEVLSTVDGIVISAGRDSLAGFTDKPGRPAHDVIYIMDSRGWCHGFFHLFSIDPSIHPGVRVKMGQKIGLLGKEGSAGGWTHLHFTIKCKQPSGKWGDEYAFPFIWEAYINQYSPKTIAISRPHAFVSAGDKVILNGNKSKSFEGEIISYNWIFSDGSTASGARQKRTYTIPGTYSEVLKIIDSKGNIDYDYTVVQVVNKKEPKKLPPTIHAVYYPTMGIKAGDPVTFGVRTFRTSHGYEEWDFGDGSEKIIVKSILPENKRSDKYAEVIHSYEKPGDYLVRVERIDENGYKAIARLHVEVE